MKRRERLEFGFALGIGYALGRWSRPKPPGAARPRPVDRDPAVERLRAEALAFVLSRAQPLLTAIGRGLGELSARIGDIAQGDSPTLARLALAVGRHVTRGGRRPLTAAEYDEERERAPLAREEGGRP